jgi:hypothetical protein
MRAYKLLISDTFKNSRSIIDGLGYIWTVTVLLFLLLFIVAIMRGIHIYVPENTVWLG